MKGKFLSSASKKKPLMWSHRQSKDLDAYKSSYEKCTQEVSFQKSLTHKRTSSVVQSPKEAVESLKTLIVVNEDQKKQIEVLKEALEIKVEDLGISNMLTNAIGGNLTQGEALTKWILMSKESEMNKKALSEKQEYIEEMEKLLVNLKEQNEQQKQQLQRLTSKYKETISNKEQEIRELRAIVM